MKTLRSYIFSVLCLLVITPALAFPPFGMMVGKGCMCGPDFFLAQYIGSNGNATSWTAQPIGSAEASRILVIVVNGGGATAPTGITVDGNAMTSQVQSGSGPGTRIWSLAWPTGTTADIAVTGSSSASLNFIHVYALYGLSSITAVDTGTAAATTTVSCDGTKNGVVIGGAYRQSSAIAVSSSGGFVPNSQQIVSGNYAVSGSQIYTPSTAAQTMTTSAAATTLACVAYGPP